MRALTYTTKTAAEAAQAEIARQMGLGLPGNVTTRWADPVKTDKGKWAIEEPDQRFTDGMTVKVEEVTLPVVDIMPVEVPVLDESAKPV